MNRGITEVATVGAAVTLLARTKHGIVAFQLTVAAGAYGSFVADALRQLLDRVDPVDEDRSEVLEQWLHRKPVDDGEREPEPGFTESEIRDAIDDLLSGGDAWKRDTPYHAPRRLSP